VVIKVEIKSLCPPPDLYLVAIALPSLAAAQFQTLSPMNQDCLTVISRYGRMPDYTGQKDIQESEKS